MGEQTPVIIGPSISQDIAYVHVEKKKYSPTVIVGDGIQKDVAIFMSYVYPEQNEMIIDAFQDDEIIDEEDFEE
ncbi:MAG: hypothetical protein K6G51_03250 [Sphaerochaetaceae bacterium]|nr:hypothetical protein [Sphaerochaetaceae bacterium]